MVRVIDRRVDVRVGLATERGGEAIETGDPLFSLIQNRNVVAKVALQAIERVAIDRRQPNRTCAVEFTTKFSAARHGISSRGLMAIVTSSNSCGEKRPEPLVKLAMFCPSVVAGGARGKGCAS